MPVCAHEQACRLVPELLRLDVKAGDLAHTRRALPRCLGLERAVGVEHKVQAGTQGIQVKHALDGFVEDGGLAVALLLDAHGGGEHEGSVEKARLDRGA